MKQLLQPLCYEISARSAKLSEKEIKYTQLYMDIASRVSEMSFCKLLRVGAVAVRNGRILSMGWNGMPSGFENGCECENGKETKDEVIHAEINCIAKLAACTDSSLGASMYITHAPCLRCAKLIIQSGIETVYFVHEYCLTEEPKREGLDILLKKETKVFQLNNNKVLRIERRIARCRQPS